MGRVFAIKMLSRISLFFVVVCFKDVLSSSNSTDGVNVVVPGDSTTAVPAPAGDPASADGMTDDSKKLALFIILPIFFLCYGGACVLYCVHKIIKHCVYRKQPPAKMKLVPPEDGRIPAPAPIMKQPRPVSSRPLSANKVHPTPIEMAGPLPEKSPLNFFNYQHASNAPTKKDISLDIFGITNDVPLTARNIDVVEDRPPSYTDKREERKARLLENAAKEARERRTKEEEEGRPASRPFTAPKREAPPPPKPAVEPIPENTGSTTNLLSQCADSPRGGTPPQNMAGMSISEILRMKMAQQANKKRPKKILAS